MGAATAGSCACTHSAVASPASPKERAGARVAEGGSSRKLVDHVASSTRHIRHRWRPSPSHTLAPAPAKSASTSAKRNKERTAETSPSCGAKIACLALSAPSPPNLLSRLRRGRACDVAGLTCAIAAGALSFIIRSHSRRLRTLTLCSRSFASLCASTQIMQLGRWSLKVATCCLQDSSVVSALNFESQV